MPAQLAGTARIGTPRRSTRVKLDELPTDAPTGPGHRNPTGPRVGFTGAWFDPTDPRVWSGIPTNLISELGALGVYGGYRDATPWAPAAGAVRRWLELTGRRTETWPLKVEMRLLASLTNAAGRLSTPSEIGAWVVPAGAFGRPVRGRIVSLSEIAPSQLAALGPAGAAAFGMAELSERGLGSVVRQQRRLHRRARACCVASSWAAEALLSEGIDPARVQVVGYGRNIDIPPPPGRDWSTPRFLFVGNDWERKNGEAVVEAFRRLRAEHPAATLDLVGLHPRIDEPGVSGQGRLAFDEAEGRARLEALFARATCFVMPSRLEPFGIVYLEAAGAGLPSIGTTRGGTASSIGSGGILVDPDDPAGLLGAMGRLADPARAQELGARARARSHSFSWRLTAERVLRATGLVDADRLGLAPFLTGDLPGNLAGDLP